MVLVFGLPHAYFCRISLVAVKRRCVWLFDKVYHWGTIAIMLSSSFCFSVLTRVHALLTQGWCQYDFAQQADGVGCFVGSSEACGWSLAGALCLSLHEHREAVRFPLVMEKLRCLLPPGQRDPEEWQDLPTTTQRDVLALVERTMMQAVQQSREAP